MKRRRVPVPVLLMSLVLLAALVSSVMRKDGLPRIGGGEESRPEDVVLAAFDAAKRGDAGAYVACFKGTLRDDLLRSREEMGDERFREYLRESTAAVKGIALSDRADAGEGELRIRVEYVYSDRNDVQHYSLCREGGSRGAWVVCGITTSRRARTLVPYGTEAVPLGR